MVPDGLALPDDLEGSRNCGLVALSVVARCSYAEAVRAYTDVFRSAYQRHPRKNWKGGTTWSLVVKAMASLGVQHSHTEVTSAVTLQRLAQFTRRDALYLVCTTGHAQVVKNGWVIDQRGAVPVEQHWGRRKRVTAFHAIKED
ncbi:hypothetical protein KAJ83_01505 [Marivibrio halodurans]|uniref:Uncharacterized protein n=1 Tax=Marivibrio halodurans TaxID=2039722 RepID=A0A8J7SGE1_9PROT|nr:hypothetical protein [Marivibrio halodurans]MBP5855668.1 hypothetical protein [Marivibrio halodurans]